MLDTITAGKASSTRCAVLKIGLKGRFVYIDDRAEELLGYTRETLFGKSVFDYLSDDSREALERFIIQRGRFESSYETLPFALRDGSGTYRRYNAVISLNFVNGNPVNFQIILKPPEAPTREAVSPPPVELPPSQWFSKIGELTASMAIGAAAIADDFQTIYKNDVFIRDFEGGVDATETDFASIWDRLRLYREAGRTIPFEESPVFRSVAERQPTSSILYISGALRNVLVSSAPVVIADRCFWQILFIPLPPEDRCHEQTHQAVDRIIQSLAHDVSAPLSAINALVRQLQDGYSKTLSENGFQALGCIGENSRIMGRMIEGLSELSRIHLAAEAPEIVATRKLVADLVLLMRDAYSQTQYAVTVDEKLPDLEVPRRKLMALMRHLLDNAFKYSAGVAQPAIMIEYTRDGEWHRFSISDNGPGIRPDYLQEIFEPLFRAPEAVAIPGAGIGLAVAYDIVLSLGGAIWCDASSSGCRIVFTLPADGNH